MLRRPQATRSSHHVGRLAIKKAVSFREPLGTRTGAGTSLCVLNRLTGDDSVWNIYKEETERLRHIEIIVCVDEQQVQF